MYEIEMKAHVWDKEEVRNNLKKFATIGKSLEKSDQYWKHSSTHQQIRIRKEQIDNTITYLVTYKRKQNKVTKSGNTMEVNDEQEFTIDNPKALACFLKDGGYEISLHKEKKVEQWHYQNFLLELCQVPPLGDFLEIEIISDSDKPAIIQAYEQQISHIFTFCGIPETDIENKYYSQLLEERSCLKGQNSKRKQKTS